MLNLVIVEDLELSESLLHLVNSASAVDKLDWVLGLGESVTCDEGEEGDGLARACGHLQEAVALSVQGSLELEHVCILLWVYVVVWEVDCDVFYLKLHGFLRFWVLLCIFSVSLGDQRLAVSQLKRRDLTLLPYHEDVRESDWASIRIYSLGPFGAEMDKMIISAKFWVYVNMFCIFSNVSVKITC